MEKREQEINNNDEENQKLYPHQLPLITLFTWFISILNGKAWEFLGLMMNPETKKINKDLKKARISINSIECLLENIKDELKEDEKSQLENLLANLQMNYVEKTKEKNE